MINLKIIEVRVNKLAPMGRAEATVNAKVQAVIPVQPRTINVKFAKELVISSRSVSRREVKLPGGEEETERTRPGQIKSVSTSCKAVPRNHLLMTMSRYL